MRYQDYSPIAMKDGKLSLGDRVQGMLKYGFSWPNQMKSQETVVRYFSRVLDQRFTLFRNIPLADEIRMPLLLVGPPGIKVINPDPTRGIYRAVGNNWLLASGQNYVPAKPNLIRRTALFARVAERTLRELDFSEVEVDGVLACTNPGIHVETAEPEVRILLVDAIAPYANRLMQAASVLNAEQVRAIASVLEDTVIPDDEMGADQDGVSEFRQRRKTRQPSPLDEALTSIDESLNFSTAQWIFLVVLLGGAVLVLLVFLVYIVYLL